MSYSEDIFRRIKEMDEMEAKKVLAEVFSKFMKVNRDGYTKENCFNDLHEIYRDFVIKGIFK